MEKLKEENLNYATKSEKSEENEVNKEQKNFYRVINTFKTYSLISIKTIDEKINFLQKLSQNHQIKLNSYKDFLNKQKECIKVNEVLMNCIVDDVDIFENENVYSCQNQELILKNPNYAPKKNYHEKTHSILRQIVREWTLEGEKERKSSYEPFLIELDKRFGNKVKNDINVLVPGAGLGRLPFEIARKGYTCEGNEYSLFMLFTSSFILNKCSKSTIIYPFVHSNLNNYSQENQLRAIKFPDVQPNQVNTINSNFSMVGGSFIEIYNDFNHWDCICTCFFIDTTNNILDYVEKIYKILKPGGIWINLGPLLYHYADKPYESIEPSYDILKEAIKSFGFKYLDEKLNLPMHYTQNENTMLINEYKCVFFVCEKNIY